MCRAAIGTCRYTINHASNLPYNHTFFCLLRTSIGFSASVFCALVDFHMHEYIPWMWFSIRRLSTTWCRCSDSISNTSIPPSADRRSHTAQPTDRSSIDRRAAAIDAVRPEPQPARRKSLAMTCVLRPPLSSHHVSSGPLSGSLHAWPPGLCWGRSPARLFRKGESSRAERPTTPPSHPVFLFLLRFSIHPSALGERGEKRRLLHRPDVDSLRVSHQRHCMLAWIRDTFPWPVVLS